MVVELTASLGRLRGSRASQRVFLSSVEIQLFDLLLHCTFGPLEHAADFCDANALCKLLCQVFIFLLGPVGPIVRKIILALPHTFHYFTVNLFISHR